MDIDWEDVQACLRGEQDGFTRIIKRYESRIAAQMSQFSRDVFVREELVQDAFVEAYFSLKRYKPKAPFLHWLRKIASRVGYRYWKKQKHIHKYVSLEELDSEQTGSRNVWNDPEQAEILLHTLLAHLPPKDRLVLSMMYFEDCQVSEIADRMAWTKPMVKMRAYRARKKLRAILGKENFEEVFDGYLRGNGTTGQDGA